MNVITLNVPSHVRYINQWENLQLPKGHYIMDKVVTGCGFTEFFLNNNIPTILCSPRKVLLENKHNQHLKNSKKDKKILPTYLFKNEIDKDTTVDFSLSEKFNNEIINISDKKEYILGLRRNLANYITTSTTTLKILVTYDSLRHVLETISEINPLFINQFQVVDVVI